MKQKIAYFSNTDFSLHNYRKELMGEMKQKGFKIFALAPFTDKYFVEKIEGQGIKFINTPFKQGFDFLGGDLIYFSKIFFFMQKRKILFMS